MPMRFSAFIRTERDMKIFIYQRKADSNNT